LDEGFVKRAIAAVEEAPPENQVRAGLEALIALAETDLAAARSALHEFRTDHLRLSQVEIWLGGDSNRATFGLGAAIQIADAELSADEPDLAKIEPELLRWLEGD
jgi:hypothetical protein